MVWKTDVVLNVVSTPFTNSSFVGPLVFASTLDFQLLNVTIVFQGLSFRAGFCISNLQNRPLPRRSGRSPFEPYMKAHNVCEVWSLSLVTVFHGGSRAWRYTAHSLHRKITGADTGKFLIHGVAAATSNKRAHVLTLDLRKSSQNQFFAYQRLRGHNLLEVEGSTPGSGSSDSSYSCSCDCTCSCKCSCSGF